MGTGKKLMVKSLDEHQLEFEPVPDLPHVPKLGSIINHHPIEVRKIKVTMSKEMKAPKMKPYAPSRVEVAKTVIIAILLTSVIAFVTGMNFQKSQTAEVQNAVHAAQDQVKK